MAASFAASFGHPSHSPWAKVPFSDFPPYDVPRFIEALEALRGPALATREAITRYAGVGVLDVGSFVAAAGLAEKLPELPDFDLAAIADLDIDDFIEALSVQADLVKTEKELQAIPDLRHEDPDKLAIAAVHMRSAASSEFLGRARRRYELADVETMALEALAEAVEGVIPVLEPFASGLDPHDAPTGGSISQLRAWHVAVPCETLDR